MDDRQPTTPPMRDDRKAASQPSFHDPAAVETFYRQNYIAAQYVFVQFFADHLSDLSRTFRGDLQMMLILATLGQVHLERVRRKLGPVAADDVPLDIDIGWTTSSRLADVTGIPRQTVRRKLLSLQQLGWVIQNEQQGWAIHREGGTRAHSDLSDIDTRAMRRISKFVADFTTLMSKTSPGLALILAT